MKWAVGRAPIRHSATWATRTSTRRSGPSIFRRHTRALSARIWCSTLADLCGATITTITERQSAGRSGPDKSSNFINHPEPHADEHGGALGFLVRKGIHNLKMGAQYGQTFLREHDGLGVVDATYNSPCVDAGGNPLPGYTSRRSVREAWRGRIRITWLCLLLTT